MAKDKRRSFSNMTMRILVPVVLLLLIVFLLMVRGMREARTLAYQYIMDTAELYVSQVNRSLNMVGAEHILRMDQGKAIEEMLPAQIAPTDGRYILPIINLMRQNSTLRVRHPGTSSFFLYDTRSELLILDTGVYYKSSLSTPQIDAQRSFLRSLQPSANTQWHYFHNGAAWYIAGTYYQNSLISGSLMPVDTLFGSLTKSTKGYVILPFIQTPEGEIIAPSDDSGHPEPLALVEMEEAEGEFYRFPLRSGGTVGMTVRSERGHLENVLQMQALLGLLAIIIALGVAVGALMYYRKILVPIKYFTQGLKRAQQTARPDQRGAAKSHIAELEVANTEFQTLVREIRQLENDVYEKELARQKIELDYRQEQINPHFFLNCLSIIHGIAEESGEKKIVDIVGTLADYMRYVFKDTSLSRSVQEELDHVRDYIRIQKMRYGDAVFAFDVIVDDDVLQCRVPSLLFQIIIENAFTHAVTLDKKIEISMYLALETRETGRFLYISLSDTGRGFSDEVLHALKNDTPIEYGGRHHVGLQNVVQRLRLMYKGRAQIGFSNMQEGFGAIIEIAIPLDRPWSSPAAGGNEY